MLFRSGLLPHHTTWRWAYACGRAGEQGPVALNLVQGFNGAVECAAWVRRGAGWEIVPLEEARIEYQAVDRPWQVNTPDGAVDLTFTPTGCHREHRDLGLVRSRFVQAAGHFSGRLTLPGGPAVPFDRVPGVTEDQDLRW